MAHYMTMHTLACLTRQGAEALAQKLAASIAVQARRVSCNMVEGKMLVEFEAADREALERWLQTEGLHFDWLLRLEFELADGKLQPLD